MLKLHFRAKIKNTDANIVRKVICGRESEKLFVQIRHLSVRWSH